MLWVAAAMAGVMILALGLLRMGRVVTLVPSPVVAGFTTGIALVIASGQLDNVLGLKLGADGLSLVMLLLTALVTVAAVMFGSQSEVLEKSAMYRKTCSTGLGLSTVPV